MHDWENLVQKAIKTKTKASLLLSSMLREMTQHVAHSKQPIESTKSSANNQKLDSYQLYGSQLIQKPKPTAAMPLLFFPYPKVKESPRIWDLRDESSLYNKPFVQSEKIDKTSGKKSQREKKEQYYLQQAQDSKILTTNTNIACNSRVQNDKKRKNLSYITCFNCDKESYYTDKCLKPSNNRDVIKN